MLSTLLKIRVNLLVPMYLVIQEVGIYVGVDVYVGVGFCEVSG